MADTWEWASMYEDGDLDDGPDEASARAAVEYDTTRRLVRRRVSPWEVVS